MDVKEAYKDFFGVEPADNGTTVNYSVLAFAEHFAKLKAGQHETIVIALEKRRKQFEETYEKESSSGNFMNADKAGFYEECYRNVIKDLKEEVL